MQEVLLFIYLPFVPMGAYENSTVTIEKRWKLKNNRNSCDERMIKAAEGEQGQKSYFICLKHTGTVSFNKICEMSLETVC